MEMHNTYLVETGDVEELPYVILYQIREFWCAAHWRFEDNPCWTMFAVKKGVWCPMGPITDYSRDSILKHFGLWETDWRQRCSREKLEKKSPVFLIRARRKYEATYGIARIYPHSADREYPYAAMFVS
jgi:hypothetical protein